MTELAYAVHGPKEGLPIVLLHGFPFDRRMWRFQIGPLIASGYRVILPDLVGHGATDPIPEASIDGMADDIAQLMDRLRIEQAVIVGFSMGGYVALSFAVRHHTKLNGLVLIDTRPGADSADAKTKRTATIKEVNVHGTRVVAMPMLLKQLTETTRTKQRLLTEEIRDLMLRQPKLGVMGALGALRDRPDRSGDLKTIGVPTLVLVGEHDAITPPADAQLMAEGIRGASLVTITEAAHLSPMEQPKQVNKALLDWLPVVVGIKS